MEHSLCPSPGPPHAGSLHPVLHQVTAGAFGHAAADWIAGLQVLVVSHVLAVVLVVRDGRGNPSSFLAFESMRVAEPPKPTDHAPDFPFQEHLESMGVELLCCRTSLTVEAVGGRPLTRFEIQ